MDTVTTAQLIINGISAMAAVVQAWKTGNGMRKCDIEEKLESSSSSSSVNEYSTLTPSPSALAMSVIDPAILDAILSNVKKEKENLRKALTDDANSNQEKDRAVEISSSVICGDLQRIKILNNGVLPSSELHKVALSFGC